MIGRRSVLTLLGLGPAGAAMGGPDAGRAGANSLFPHADYAAAAGQGLHGRPPAIGVAEISANRAKAVRWLQQNGLPDYARERIRREARQEATHMALPAEIAAYRSFAPHMKRRLHEQQIARQQERERLDGQINGLLDQAKHALLPDFVRNFAGWL